MFFPVSKQINKYKIFQKNHFKNCSKFIKMSVNNSFLRESKIFKKKIHCLECSKTPLINLQYINNEPIICYKCQDDHMGKVPLSIFLENSQNMKNDFNCTICGQILEENCYYCLNCQIITCEKCKIIHDKEKNHNSLESFIENENLCTNHCTSFFAYCLQCKKNICTYCKNHLEHEKFIFFDHFFKKTQLNNFIQSIENSKKFINKLNDIQNKIKDFYSHQIIFCDKIFNSYKKINEDEIKLCEILFDNYTYRFETHSVTYPVIKNIQNILQFKDYNNINLNIKFNYFNSEKYMDFFKNISNSILNSSGLLLEFEGIQIKKNIDYNNDENKEKTINKIDIKKEINNEKKEIKNKIYEIQKDIKNDKNENNKSDIENKNKKIENKKKQKEIENNKNENKNKQKDIKNNKIENNKSDIEFENNKIENNKSDIENESNKNENNKSDIENENNKIENKNKKKEINNKNEMNNEEKNIYNQNEIKNKNEMMKNIKKEIKNIHKDNYINENKYKNKETEKDKNEIENNKINQNEQKTIKNKQKENKNKEKEIKNDIQNNEFNKKRNRDDKNENKKKNEKKQKINQIKKIKINEIYNQKDENDQISIEIKKEINSYSNLKINQNNNLNKIKKDNELISNEMSSNNIPVLSSISPISKINDNNILKTQNDESEDFIDDCLNVINKEINKQSNITINLNNTILSNNTNLSLNGFMKIKSNVNQNNEKKNQNQKALSNKNLTLSKEEENIQSNMSILIQSISEIDTQLISSEFNKSNNNLNSPILKIPKDINEKFLCDKFNELINIIPPLENCSKLETKFLIESKNDRYFGEIKGKKRHGRGIWYVDNGLYEGYFYNDLANGYGKFTSPNGDFFQGEWENSKKKKGREILSNGNEFNGEYKNDHFSFGKFIDKDKNEIYEGQFINNIKNGKGNLTVRENGEDVIYEGEWVNDKLNGSCVIKYSSGNIEEAVFVNGNLCDKRRKFDYKQKKWIEL